MIALLILFLTLVVFLAVFIGNNLSNLCNFWFLHTYSEVPVLILIFISFAAGIVFSILIFSIGKFRAMTKENQKSVQKEQEDQKSKDKKEKIKNKIKLGKKKTNSDATVVDVNIQAEKSDK